MLLAALMLVGCSVGKRDKADIRCTKVTVKVKGEGYRDIDITDDMNTRLVGFYTKEKLRKVKDVDDLALEDKVRVYYSDGGEISSDTNDDTYAWYTNGKKGYHITVDKEFKEYLTSLVDE